MIQTIAYRLQVRAFGGLSPRTRKALAGTGRVGSSRRPRIVRHIRLSTLFIREWQGRTITAVAAEGGGFDLEGKRYRSLSAIARAVTGTRWSGPVFFGLSPEAKR